ncbi:hypothetical protein CRYUN_Cryun03dG0102700 [Craigia yunnanensis]
MESFESEEPEKKRHHLDSPAMARNSSTSPNHTKTVGAAVLQYQNQKLVQQLDIQKHELHDLETKIKELKDKQTSYDDMLITVNQLWNQLVDDLILLGVRAGGGCNALEILDHKDNSRGSIPSCPVEEMFLCRLLETDFLDSSGDDGIANHVEQVLSSRHSSTRELIKSLEDSISAERVRTGTLLGKVSVEASCCYLKIDDMMKEEAKNLHDVVHTLHLKHKEYADGIQRYLSSHSTDHIWDAYINSSCSKWQLITAKSGDKTIGLREIKDLIEETKMVAADRRSELQDAQEQNLIYSKQLKDLQNELKDDKFIQSSRFYTLLNDQLQRWNAEMEQYKALTDALQTDRFHIMRREKELNIKAESADAARNTIDNADSRIEELELQLQKCIIERNDLEIKMEEAIQDAGRNDVKAEFHVMASALSKEMGMMEGQLKRRKETAHEAISLHEEAQTLKALLSDKTNQQKCLVEECAEQIVEIKSLNDLIEKLQKEKLELQIYLDMYGQEGYDNRDLMEIRESENRAHSQAEVLKNALDEHSLELRVKAANEAEAACQERLSVAEAEIAELRAKLDASESSFSQECSSNVIEKKDHVEEKRVYDVTVVSISLVFDALKNNLVEEGLRDEMHEKESVELLQHDLLDENAESIACETKFVAIQKPEEFDQMFPFEDLSHVELIHPINEIKPIVVDYSSSIDFIIPSVLKKNEGYDNLRGILRRSRGLMESKSWNMLKKLDSCADPVGGVAMEDVLELTEAIKSKDRETETYISEIETIGQAYEDMQTQNQHLLQQMTQRDNYNIKLVSESAKTKQAHSFFLSEKQTLARQLQQVNSSIESVKMRIAQSEEQMKVCLTDAIKFTQEDRHFTFSLETAKWELADAEKELKCLKSAAASSEKDYEQLQLKVDEFQVKLDKERSQRKKLEEDLHELNSKVAELSSETGETAKQKLQNEIKTCKNILKCSVCFDRPKEVVIVKCYHLFCNPCIQRNLGIRHRKCPGCGTAFGQNDVRFVKI